MDHLTDNEISQIAEAAIEACGLSPWDWARLREVERAIKILQLSAKLATD